MITYNPSLALQQAGCAIVGESHPCVPLVSIVTPTYNSASFISETIASVAAQDFQNWEHIIVDDGSSDETVSIIKNQMTLDPRIKLITLDHNEGAAVARNAAIDASLGRFIAFLDADDLWLPSKLMIQIDYMLKNNAPFTYPSYQVIDEHGVGRNAVHAPLRVSYNKILRNNTIGCLTAVYDTGYFGRVQMPLIRKRQDLGLWLKLLRCVPYAVSIPQVLAQYRVRPGSISHNKVSAAKFTWKLYREVEKLPLAPALYNFLFYAINGVFNSVWLSRNQQRASASEPQALTKAHQGKSRST